MDEKLTALEDQLTRERAMHSVDAPSRFFGAVRSRRRRIVTRRVSVALLIALCVGFGVWGMTARSHPAATENPAASPYIGLASLRRLREPPPEIPPGVGTEDVTRVLDSRDPASLGLGGF